MTPVPFAARATVVALAVSLASGGARASAAAEAGIRVLTSDPGALVLP